MLSFSTDAREAKFVSGATAALCPSCRVTGKSPPSCLSAPSKIYSSPLPPASTTPACFNTGSISGVCARTLCPSSIMPFRNTSISSVSSASLTAASAQPLATVRIVPSLGFITALYAVFTACSAAAASSCAPASSMPSNAFAKPRKI